jgi:hypothetical protein
LNQAIVIDPTNSEAYYYRGLSKILQGLKKNGCLDLNKALELGRVETQFLIREFCKENAPPPTRRR